MTVVPVIPDPVIPDPVIPAPVQIPHGRRTGGATSSRTDARPASVQSGPEPVPESGPDPVAPPAPAIEILRVVAWPDPVIDRLGYDPRSLYVETFWLGILGPTCTWLMRRFAAGLDESPTGFDLDMADTARALGLGGRSGRQSPFRRALARCVTFQMARRDGPTTLAVRRRIPPMARRHLDRLPAPLQERHAQWMIPPRSSPVLEEARRNARRLALALLASGNERPEVELQLVRWHVHPALAHEAAQWAWAYRAHEATSSRAGGRRPAVVNGSHAGSLSRPGDVT